jgi:lysophosphatidate acyltransferase
MRGKISAFLLILVLIGVAFVFSVIALFRWGDLNLNHRFMQTFSRLGLLTTGIKARFLNVERLTNTPCAVIIANHQSAFDVVMFGGITPTRCIGIAKKELSYIPFFGWFLKAAGVILIDRKKAKAAAEQVASFAPRIKSERLRIGIFPEGTRSRPVQGQTPKLLPFKASAFRLAIQAQVPIVPMVCGSIAGIAEWEKGIFARGKQLSLQILEPIPTLGLKEEDTRALSERVHAIMQAELIRLSESDRLVAEEVQPK